MEIYIVMNGDNEGGVVNATFQEREKAEAYIASQDFPDEFWVVVCNLQ